MKKKLLILPLLLAGMAITACENPFKKKSAEDDDDTWIVVPEIEGGSDAEKHAILEAVNNKSVCINKSGGDLFPTSKNINFDGNENDYIKVAKVVNVGDLVVNLTWDFKQTQATFNAVLAVNETTDLVYVNYPASGTATYEWSLTKITCGKAVSTKTNSDYKATLTAPTHEWKAYTIAEVLAVNDTQQDFVIDEGTAKEATYTFEGTSNLINYEAKNSKGTYSPWWKTGLAADAEDNYIFAEVKGKVMFLSEDGNWGLIGDGAHVLEIYSGSELDLKTTVYPELKVGEYVSVKGEVNHYYGNFQLSFIKSIRKCDKGSIADPAAATALSEANLAAAKLTGADRIKEGRPYKQFTAAIEHNSLRTVTGTVVAGSKKSGSNGRFTFDIMVGAEKMEVAYDYHSDKNSKVVSTKLNSKVVDNASVTITGTMRFSHNQDKTLIPTDGSGGNWSVVPYLVEQIA